MIEITMAGIAKNAIGTDMLAFLLEKIGAANGAPILLSGSGDAFSAGINLKEVMTLDREGMAQFLAMFERCMSALYFYPGPTVACVNGHAIAGGCLLALCCDRRVIASNPKIKIGLNEVALGVRFPPMTLAIVRNRISRRHIDEVVLGARLFDPISAVRVGLVDEIADDPVSVARARSLELAAHSPTVYAAVKRDLRGVEDDISPPQTKDGDLQEAVAVWTSTDVRNKFASALAPRA